MDWTAVATSIIAGVVSIGGVGIFLAKYMPKISAWTALAKDGVETIDDISEALKPDSTGKVELTPDEIKKINEDAIKFKTQLAILLGK